MPQPRKLTDEAQAEIEWVGLARDQLPTDKELAMKYRVCVQRIHQIMQGARTKTLVKLLGSTINTELTDEELDKLADDVRARVG